MTEQNIKPCGHCDSTRIRIIKRVDTSLSIKEINELKDMGLKIFLIEEFICIELNVVSVE